MSLLPFDVTMPPGSPRGRTLKFTPERMDQIRNLVERGKTRNEIADIIGCTVGSLQVTCSRAGISLRHPKSDVMLLPKKPIEKTNGQRFGPNEAIKSPTDVRPPVENKAKAALILRLQVIGRSRDFDVAMPPELIGRLAILAELRDVSLGELVVEALAEAIAGLEGKDGTEK